MGWDPNRRQFISATAALFVPQVVASAADRPPATPPSTYQFRANVAPGSTIRLRFHSTVLIARGSAHNF